MNKSNKTNKSNKRNKTKNLIFKKGYVESYYKYAREKAATRFEHRIENYEGKESVKDTLYERLENTPCGFDERTHNINL